MNYDKSSKRCARSLDIQSQHIYQCALCKVLDDLWSLSPGEEVIIIISCQSVSKNHSPFSYKLTERSVDLLGANEHFAQKDNFWILPPKEANIDISCHNVNCIYLL